MAPPQERWARTGRGIAAVAVFLCAAVSDIATAAPPLDALDGRSFAGSLPAGNEPDPDKDTLIFHDGMFISRLCRQYGFSPAPYWVRRDEEGLHFRVDLDSTEQGHLRFRGVFDGGTMRATVTWTKERWYWTVEQTLMFTGHPVDTAQ